MAPRKKKKIVKKKGTHGGNRWDGRKKFKSHKKGANWVNHQGRITLTAVLFGLIRSGLEEAQIHERVKQMFPWSSYNNHPHRTLTFYRSRERKDRAKKSGA